LLLPAPPDAVKIKEIVNLFVTSPTTVWWLYLTCHPLYVMLYKLKCFYRIQLLPSQYVMLYKLKCFYIWGCEINKFYLPNM
jgi:hypothetical protein